MDSASITPSPTVDNSDAGELQQWIEENDSLTPVEKELFSELDPNLL